MFNNVSNPKNYIDLRHVTVPSKSKGYLLYEPTQLEEREQYQGFFFSVDPTTEELNIIENLQALRSKAVIETISLVTKYFQTIKPKKIKKGKGKITKVTKQAQGKGGAAATHGLVPLSKDKLISFKRKLKRALLKKGWSGRMANNIINEAFQYVKVK